MSEKLVQCLKEDWGIYNKELLKAFKDISRADFLPEEYAEYADKNIAVEVLNFQTSTKPSTIARFLQLAKVNSSSVVLELGTGSGYQTAIIASIAKYVVSYEIDEDLYSWASSRLCNYSNIELIADNPLDRKFDREYDNIIFSFALNDISGNFISALRNKGSIIAPIIKGKNQFLLHIFKENDTIKNTYLNYERFVKVRGIIDDE